MLTGIDHLVIASADPDAAAAELEATVGLRAAGGGRHERLGTFNRLVWLGDTYLELIGVWDASLAAASWIGAPTLRALERGGGFVSFALASDGLAADVERLRGHGSQLDGPMSGERTRPDGRTVRWSLAVPPGLGPDAPPFLIEHDPAAAEWTPAERAERAAERHPLGAPARLETLELATPDVQRSQGRLLRSCGLRFRPSLAGRGARDASVGRQTVRLVRSVEAGAPGRPLLRLSAMGHVEARTADVLGCRFRLEGQGSASDR